MNTSEKRVVVITGASSGIGRACVSQMLASGWRVIAGVRKEEDARKLKRELRGDLIPVILDVVDRDSIAGATTKMGSLLDGQGLHGLVNVAGIGMIRPIEYVRPSDLEAIFGVNVFGQVAVTQAFLPFIRKAAGRIVNISSVGAHIAIPFGGLLNATKAAFGLLSDAMRLELRPFGIRVSIVEPGSIKTPAVEKTLGDIAGLIHDLPPGGKELYGTMLREFTKRAYKREMNGSPPEVVAHAVHHALSAKRPRIRYVIGKDAKLLALLPRIVPDVLLDQLRRHLFGLPARFNMGSTPEKRAHMHARAMDQS